ncbi:MAG: hypothetical protein ABSE27_06785 [Acidobacteriaceae bacterium]|jgi:hypothetical protein
MANETNQGGSSIPALLCFATLAGLAAYRGNPSLKPVAVAAIGGLAAAWLCLWLFGRLLYIFNGAVRQKYGWRGVRQAVGRNFLLIIPYTVLALLADLVLGWNASLTFASAGIMTSGSAVGAELMAKGGGKIANMLLPVCGGMGFTMLWMVIGSLLRAVAR